MVHQRQHQHRYRPHDYPNIHCGMAVLYRFLGSRNFAFQLIWTRLFPYSFFFRHRIEGMFSQAPSPLVHHVNRIPASGTIKKIVYRPGLFLNAGNERASIENERCAALLDLDDGRELAFVQIAGLIARRIICEAKEGDSVKKGERYGLIRFGSRCDIYLPQGVTAQVAVGQRMIGGETVLDNLKSSEPQREASPI